MAEAEFRLSNDLYDVSNIVGGANGGKVGSLQPSRAFDYQTDSIQLSERYREILFSMIAANSSKLSSSEIAVRDDQVRCVKASHTRETTASGCTNI